MLPLESQITSLELSKRLKELGVKQESLFVWYPLWEYYDDECHIIKFIPDSVIPKDNKFKLYSAFTVAELGVLIPYEILDKFLVIEKCFSNLWQLKYIDENYLRESIIVEIKDYNEANCRAKMLIYLLENNIVKVEDINNALD